ncbi:hypothetical protein BH09VER1_BH09VER1_47930 [soil metagenome]
MPGGQGRGSASPEGKARALAPSQNYRFGHNPHGPTKGRRRQIRVGLAQRVDALLKKLMKARSPPADPPCLLLDFMVLTIPKPDHVSQPKNTIQSPWEQKRFLPKITRRSASPVPQTFSPPTWEPCRKTTSHPPKMRHLSTRRFRVANHQKSPQNGVTDLHPPSARSFRAYLRISPVMKSLSPFFPTQIPSKPKAKTPLLPPPKPLKSTPKNPHSHRPQITL